MLWELCGKAPHVGVATLEGFLGDDCLRFLRRILNFRMTPCKLSKLCDATEPLVAPATSRPMEPVPTDKQIEPQIPPYVSLTTFMKYMGI